MSAARGSPEPLRAYAPDLLLDWVHHAPWERHRRVEGTLAFVDISGFTRLTERLARHGRVGAEEMSDALNAVFGELVTVAARFGGDLIKWGGDAVLMLFVGPDHAPRGVRAALDMRATLRSAGRLETTAGKVSLRMSVGVHSDVFDFFLVGDPAIHRELLVSGPAASEVARLEAIATAGQVVVGDRTAALLSPRDTRRLDDAGAHLARSAQPGDAWPSSPGLVPTQRSAEGSLADYLPVEIRRRLLAGMILPEHRPITVAFVQFSGTDCLVAAGDPTATVAALDEMVRNVASAAEEFGVTFFESDINADGGKIMLTAGAPRALEHQEERMLRTARRIMDRAGTLPLRIGVNRGHIFSGDFGPAFRRTYSVKGDAINLAARVMGKAAPGQVLATEEVLRRCAAPVEADPLPPFLVKGKKHPVSAVAVRRIAEAGVHDDRPSGRGRAPLVGRDAEAALLRAAVADVRARRAAVVEVLGEPGIGKSRLLDEVRDQAADLVVISVECNEYAANTPYAACKTLLQEVLGLDDASPSALVRQRLEDRVAANRPELLPWLPLLGIPLDLDLADTQQTRDLDDEFRQDRLESVIVDFLDATLPTATLLVLDDTQVMDAASARVVGRLVTALDRLPWLVVVGRRDFPTGFVAPEGPLLQQLRLQPLDDAAAVRLVQASTTGRPLPPDAVRTLAEQCGGNPMFLESLVAAAGRTGSVAELPDSVEGVIRMLLDRLDVEDRLVVRRAAVLGRLVDTALLQGLLADTGAELDEHRLARLGDFLERDDDQLRFRHALLREVAYQGLPYRQRMRLHASVGEALESAAEPGERMELLSLHYFHAGRFEKAWTYSRGAGLRAQDRFANHEAVDFFERAVECARRRASGAPAAEVGEVLECMAEALTRMGLLEEAAAAHQRALRAFTGDPVQRAQVIARQARIDQRLRRFRPSSARLARGLSELRGLDHPEACGARAVLQLNYGICRMAQGDAAAGLAWARRSVAEAETSGQPAVVALAHATMHGILVTVGREDPVPHGRLALAAYRELQDPTGEAHCLNNLAMDAYQHYRWVDAAAGYAEAQAIFHRTGNAPDEASAMFNRAELLVRQGHHPDTLLEEALSLARAVADDELEALVLREQARSAGRAGRVDEARRLAAESVALFTELDEQEELVGCQLVVAEALVRAGQHARALTVLARTEADEDLAPSRDRIRGCALLGLAREREAEVELRRGLDAAEAVSDRYEGALNRWALGLARSDEQAARVRAGALADLRSLGIVVLPVGNLPQVAHGDLLELAPADSDVAG